MTWKPVFVYQDKVLVKIKPEEIVGLSTEDNYTKIVFSDKSNIMVRSTLASALKKLPSELFIRVHRGIAVSILYIDTIDRDHLTIGTEAVPIAKLYYKSVIDQLNIIK
jgi:DNA-binding LytR/AlgR family response regulator